MLLRCAGKRKDGKFVGTILELSIAERGDTVQQLRERLEEAVSCYFEAAVECGECCDENIVLNPVPFYWLKKTWFDWKVSKLSPKNTTTWEEKNYQLCMATG